MIRLTHNFDSKKFMWLYAKYANGCNLQYQCTNAIRGKYSICCPNNIRLAECFAEQSGIICKNQKECDIFIGGIR